MGGFPVGDSFTFAHFEFHLDPQFVDYSRLVLLRMWDCGTVGLVTPPARELYDLEAVSGTSLPP